MRQRLFLAIVIFGELAVTLALFHQLNRNLRSSGIPDALKKAPDFIEDNGYPSETYEFTTEDGFILQIHRIPFGKNGGKSENKQVVMLQHGISGSSDNWFISGPKALPYLLADEGYDVWLANTRGNAYANRHVSLSNTSQEFWNFSFHENGYYDVAASIDFALQTTNQKTLIMIAHSQATTANFVLLSLRPEYQQKIKVLFCYAPIAFLRHTKAALIRTALTFSATNLIQFTTDLLKLTTVTPILTDEMRIFRSKFCGSILGDVCPEFITLVNGPTTLLQRDTYPVLFSHYPDGTSAKATIHYLQIAANDRFAQYDEGKIKNLKIYGSEDPPLYPIHNITTPIQIFLAPKDFLTQPEDFQRLFDILPNIHRITRIENELFSHFDFLLKVALEFVYLPTIDMLKDYKN